MEGGKLQRLYTRNNTAHVERVVLCLNYGGEIRDKYGSLRRTCSLAGVNVVAESTFVGGRGRAHGAY